MSNQQPSQRPTFYYLLSETMRILFGHRRHFLILSLLFILPQSLLTTVYLQLFFFDAKSPTAASIILHVIYQILSCIVSCLAMGSIPFSSYNFLLGRRIKLISSIHSVSRSFPRLLITSSPYLLIAGVFMTNDMLSNKIDYSSLHLYGINTIAVWIVVIYLQINLALSSAIVVIESKEGFEPLRRSIRLMQGMRRALVLLILVNVAVWCGFSYGFMYLTQRDTDLLFVLRIALNIGTNMLSTLVYNIATTVLYRKATQTDRECVSLPLADDDEKTCKVDSHVMPSCDLGMA